MESKLKNNNNTFVDVFYVVKLFLFLNIFEVSFISLKATKFSPLLTRRTSCTAHGRSSKMCFHVVGALPNDGGFPTGSEMQPSKKKPAHSTCACPSTSIKQFSRRQTGRVCVGENVKLSLSFHIIFNNWLVKIWSLVPDWRHAHSLNACRANGFSSPVFQEWNCISTQGMHNAKGPVPAQTWDFYKDLVFDLVL